MSMKIDFLARGNYLKGRAKNLFLLNFTLCLFLQQNCFGFKGLSAKIFIGLKVAPFPIDQGVIGEKSDKSLKKIEKCIFVRFLGSQNCLPEEKMALKKPLPDGNWALKYHYRTGIWLSKIITGREFGSEKSLLDENWALKYYYGT